MPKTIETISYIRVGNVEHPIDAVTINGRQIPSASELLPNISSSDEGKILRVLNGQWSLFSPGSLYDEINGIDCGNEPTFAEQYLTLDILTTGTIGWKSYDDTCQKTISYSINDGTWTEITATSAGVTIPVTVGDKVRFKGVNSNYALSNTSYSGFGNVGTSTYNVYGNIMSLIYGDNFEDQLTLTTDYAFCCLFDGGNVVSAENLVLPAMSLTKHCYRAMFANCSYITSAPTELPATTIAESCYRFMFSADPLLASIPSILPATTMQKECYYGMFNGCSSITTAPELPAPTLTTSCYKQMFLNCSHLNYIKCLATDISSGSPTTGWVSGVASTGTFVKAEGMSSWTINSVNGIPTGWTVEDDAKDYLTFDIKTDGNITWKMTSSSATAKTISYSKNGGEWTEITSSTEGVSIPVVTGDEVRFKGSNNAYGDASFGGTSQFDATGNIMSLIGGDGFDDTTTLSTGSFFALFKNCTGLKSAEDLLLPATTLTQSCYAEMFYGCTGLTTAPALPATTLYHSCYNSMFNGCTSLTTAPSSINSTTLPPFSCSGMFRGCTSLTTVPTFTATTVGQRSCESMFNGCTSLTSVSSLPATTLGEYCYISMFEGCTNLVTVPSTLPATTLAEFCYYQMFKGCTGITTAPTLPATTLAQSCYNNMFNGCTSLTTAPVLPATTLAYYCYFYMFQGCTSLTTAPELPATTLVNCCYQNMFNGCTNLNYIKCLATNDNLYAGFAFSWTYGVAETGTFVKAASATSWPTGENGIPVGWIVEDIDMSGDSDSDSDTGDSESEGGDTPIDYANEYLTFNITSAGNIVTSISDNGTNNTYEYKKNDGSWTPITSTISVSPGDTVKFRGDCIRYNTIRFTSSTCGFTLSGNLMSIYDADNFASTTSLTISECFSELFKNCTGLTSAENMVMPATSLVNYCYSSMFEGCSNLTTAPVLPATTLVQGCYGTMFRYCEHLNYIKCLATDISAQYCTSSWVQYVAATGTFVKADSMTDWTINSIDGIPVGWTLINESDESTSEDSDYGDSDSDYGDSDSEEPVITVSDPVISIANNTLTITCDTTGATIYYKLGESGTYQEYTTPVALGADTTVYSYASLNGVDSVVVSEGFVHNYSLDYLTFNVLTAGNILWKSIGSGQAKTISYSINDGEWTSIAATSAGTAIPVSAGDVVRFKGTNSTYAKDKSNYSGFDGGTATYNVEGNMMSLIYGDVFEGETTLTGTYNFCSIFKQSKAVSAENMILPSTTLTNYCYRAMFSLAPNLITPPALPATTLAQGCYWYMFEKCPMSTAPDLLAPTLVQECYGNMFTGCSNLNYIKCLATTKSATNCLQTWVKDVAATGTFVKDANTTWTTGTSGIPTGWVVYDGELVEDPVINFNGENKIEISCETSGTTIYYRLGNNGNYSEYTGPITITEDVTIYTYAEKDGQQSQTVSQECEYSGHIYKFGDLIFASGPLYYGNDGYEIKDSWNYSSYGTVYGKTVGSTFFNFIEMGDLFKKSGFSESDGSILNTLDPLDGWRLPTKDEWDYIVGSTRPGSTVNGSTNKHYAFINFIHDNDVNTVNLHGVLIFPDNETITGAALTYMDSGGTTQDLTLEQFNNYLSQGCIFLHDEGFAQTGSGFSAGNNYLGYWSSSEGSSSSAAYILTTQSGLTTSNYTKSNGYLPVYLVRDTTYGKETPLEGATKSLNTWTI